MGPDFQDIFDNIPKKPARSRLESYGALIDELRNRGVTYREIAGVLTQKFGRQFPKSTINDFVRARARRRRSAARRLSRRPVILTPVVSKSAATSSIERPSDEELRKRIAALKAKKPATTPSTNGFYFDPNEPLRLIDPKKKD